jgi:hypothetical protein
MLLFLCLIFLVILLPLPSPVFLVRLDSLDTQPDILYSHDTPTHWTSTGREIVEWPTKGLNPYKQSYTAEELKDWYCVDKIDQLKVTTFVNEIASAKGHT